MVEDVVVAYKLCVPIVGASNSTNQSCCWISELKDRVCYHYETS
jgi:hypothetical protein